MKKAEAFAAQTVSELLDRLTAEEAGVRAASSDPEPVHRMRVATRRLREALPLFREYFPAECEKGARAVRRLTRALGEGRDADVQIGTVLLSLEGGASWKASPGDVPGLERLLLRLRQRRAKLQKAIVQALNRFAGDPGPKALAARARVLMGWACVEDPGGSEDKGLSDLVADAAGFGAAFREGVLSAVRDRAARVAGFGEPAPDPGNTAQLHEMRKAAKRLRYTLEIFAPPFGSAFEPHIKKIKALQDSLGSVHDRDVWIAFLPAFVERERQKTLAFQGHARSFGRVARGLARFEAAMREEREAAFTDFSALWKGLRRARWWKILLDSVAAAPWTPRS
jgi:CHAD domain-containing protein